ncbi:MAG: FAD-dependent oxidoreductase, partial [Actinomycetota bacterium]|nr:FAD-dependent oxidoreductase [Actinomycetota bacterium]
MAEGDDAAVVLSEAERATLAAICDTVVPAIERDRDPDGLWARKATDLGVDAAAAELIAGIPDPALVAGLRRLIAAIGAQGIARASQPSREQVLRNVSLSGPEAAVGVSALINMTLFLTYGAPDPASGQNPNWKSFGFPGPISPPPQVAKPLEVHEPEGSEEAIEADVCIVGSGAGGSVVAATLAARGLDVVVLEAAGYFNESDFNQLELPAYQSMYWRGGPTPTAESNVSLVSGTTLGGGTTINWTNCLRTRPRVREQWAQEFGLDGLDGPEFDAHLDAVWERLGVNDGCSELNGPQQRMRDGCEALGWTFSTITRNADPDRYAPESAGYMGFGDQSGSKQSADRTWLADAQEHGAKLLTHTRATRVLVEEGRAAGVEARWLAPDGRSAAVSVRAPRVVVAAGSLESPALLLRSGIGGPATGEHLRLHPCTAVIGVYGDDQRAWWGAPQAGLCDEFADTGDGYGLLVETAQYAPGLIGSATPWISAADHKQRMESFRYGATFIGLTRDRGHGSVGVDAAGEAIPLYSVSDERDLENLRRGIEVQTRLHEAAGAHSVLALAGGVPTWRRGDDLEAFIGGAKRVPFRAGGHKLFSAHQMGSCRMGPDPETSVADPRGELHETKGVWVGDASAFPTSSGSNPM